MLHDQADKIRVRPCPDLADVRLLICWIDFERNGLEIIVTKLSVKVEYVDLLMLPEEQILFVHDELSIPVVLCSVNSLVLLQLNYRDVPGTDLRELELQVLVVINRVVLCLGKLLVLVARMQVEPFTLSIADKIILVSDPDEKVHVVVHQELKVNGF